MRTTVVIDDELIKEAQEALGADTIRGTIELALQEALRQHRRQLLLSLRGKIDLDLTLEELERLRSEE
jgi:Arc/MetJ family transcription regulator